MDTRIFKVTFVREINEWDLYWERVTLVAGRMPSRHFHWTRFTMFARMAGDRVEIVTTTGMVAVPVHAAKTMLRSVRDARGRLVDGEAGRCLFAAYEMANA